MTSKNGDFAVKMRQINMEVTRPDLTPMVAIVFQLLTLFMIVLNFENTKSEERIKLPRDRLARPPAAKPEYELVLNFGYRQLPSGERDGSLPEVFYNETYVDVRRIGPHQETEKRVIQRTHGEQAIKDVTVVIRADSDVPNGLVQQLIEECQRTGFSKFLLRPMPEDV